MSSVGPFCANAIHNVTAIWVIPILSSIERLSRMCKVGGYCSHGSRGWIMNNEQEDGTSSSPCARGGNEGRDRTQKTWVGR